MIVEQESLSIEDRQIQSFDGFISGNAGNFSDGIQSLSETTRQSFILRGNESDNLADIPMRHRQTRISPTGNRMNRRDKWMICTQCIGNPGDEKV
jgi:hypothetical protein